jgi:hypothetical protein
MGRARRRKRRRGMRRRRPRQTLTVVMKRSANTKSELSFCHGKLECREQMSAE